MAGQISSDLADALYALELVFRDEAIPERDDRNPLIRQETLVERLGVVGITPLKARALIDRLIALGVFQVDESLVNITDFIRLDGSGESAVVKRIRRLEINRVAWSTFLAAERTHASSQGRDQAESAEGTGSRRNQGGAGQGEGDGESGRSAGDESAYRPAVAVDPSALRPAKEFLSPSFPNYKALQRALKENPWIHWDRPKTKQGMPAKNRFLIHAGDWQAFLNQPPATDPLDLSAETVDAMVREVEASKAEERRARGK